MPPALRLAALFVAAALCPLLFAAPERAAEPPPPPPVVKIDPAVTWGAWEGWGVSLCWWAKVFGDRDDLADLLFTTKPVQLDGHTLPGLGMTIARYNAGACSWNEIDGRRMVVSKNIKAFRQLESFWLDGKNPDPKGPGWDWSVDASQRAMLLKARDRGANRFELFSNSPPWWMCANDNPSGAAKDSVQNLRPDQYHNFALYLAAIARRAKDHWGIAFTTLDPFNEPTASFWYANGKQEGSYLGHAAQAAILPLVRAELDRQGLPDLPLSASDESFYDQALATWKSFSPEVRALVAQVNVHGYQGAGGRRDELHRLVVAEGGKRLWNSEYGDQGGDGLSMARNLHLDFRWLHPTAWCYWQLLDGGNKGTGGSGWGLIDADMTKGVIGKPNPKLYVFAQYSRHIRPGMVILESNDPGTVAAYDAAARKLALVTFNDSKKPRVLAYDLSPFAGTGGRVVRWITEPEGASRYEVRTDLVVKRKRLACTLPPGAIQTVEIEDLTLSAPGR